MVLQCKHDRLEEEGRERRGERGEEGRGRREGREKGEEEGGEEETPSTSTGARLAIRYQIEVFKVSYESS